jgi:hypothetical protein
LGVLCDFLFRMSSLASLQLRQLEEWGSSPSTNFQLEHVGIDAVLPFSGHSLCRWLPPHHIQRSGCLQLGPTWLNYWQLYHCVRTVGALYASSLNTIWQRLVISNISWDFYVLCKVTRKRGKFTVDVPSAGDRMAVDICLTLVTSWQSESELLYDWRFTVSLPRRQVSWGSRPESFSLATEPLQS